MSPLRGTPKASTIKRFWFSRPGAFCRPSMHMPGSSTLTRGRAEIIISSNLGSSRNMTIMAISANAPPTRGISSATLPIKWYRGMDSTTHSQQGHCTGRCPAWAVAWIISCMAMQMVIMYGMENHSPPPHRAASKMASRQTPVMIRWVMPSVLQSAGPGKRTAPAPHDNPSG